MMADGPQPAEKERGSSKCNVIHLQGKSAICMLTTAILSLVFLFEIIVLDALRPSLSLPQESLTCIPCDKMKTKANKNQGPEPTCCSAIKQRCIFLCFVRNCRKLLAHNTYYNDLKEMTAQYHYSSSDQSLIDIAEEYAACKRETHDKQPIAKVVGIVEFKRSYIVDDHHKVLWNKNGRTFYANNCVHLELEGEIFVRQPGYYIVSSQLNLRPRKNRHTLINETRLTSFIHHVDLLSDKYGTTGVLMQTMNSIEGKRGYFTSFLSAVFKLNKYDRLSVSVSHPELLDIDNSNDHFLVYYTYDLPY